MALGGIRRAILGVIGCVGACGGRSLEDGVYDLVVIGAGGSTGARGSTALGGFSQGGSLQGGSAAGGTPSSGGSAPFAGAPPGGSPTAGAPTGGAGAASSGAAGASPAGAAGSASPTTGGVGGTGEDRGPVGAAGLLVADPGIPSSDFDPASVYLFGTLTEGLCWTGAFVPLDDPGDVRAALNVCDARNPQVDRDHRLVYQHAPTNTVRRFSAEQREAASTSAKPWMNDEAIVSPSCDEMSGVWLDPDDELVYRCGESSLCDVDRCPYYRESGKKYAVPFGYELVALGYGDSSLLRDAAAREHFLRMADADPVLLEGDFDSTFRAHPAGFWYLGNDEAGAAPERFNIAFDGTITSDGKYPPPPPTSVFGVLETSQYWFQCAFDATGSAYCFGQDASVYHQDQVFRLDLDQPVAEVVYSEAARPLVWVHASDLISGP